MSRQLRKKAAILPPEAPGPSQTGDAASPVNSFTAKDQRDHLEAAIKNWAYDADADVVPIEPISSFAEKSAPFDNSEQAEAWWVWTKAKILRKTTIIKSAVALLIAVILGWMPLQRLLATTSAEAVINARVIIVRTPIEGEVTAQSANLEVGKRFQAGDELLTVKNPRSDRAALENLIRFREQLTTTVSVLQAKKKVLESHLSELAVLKERYRISRIEQLEKRISEIDAGIVSAKSQHEVTAKTLTRAQELFPKGTVPEIFVERAARDDSVAKEAINGLLERRKATQVELAAAKQGTFISDGYNDTSTSAQRALDVELQLADVNARLTGAINELAGVDRDIGKEKQRYADMSTAVVRARISGRIWEVMTAPGEHVNAGQELVRLLDCNSAIVTASVSETTYQKLKIGQHAIFRPSDNAAEVEGWVSGLSGLAAVASNDAIQPKALSGAPYHVTLKFPKLARSENCQISRSGLVTFDTTSSPNFAIAN